MAGKGPSRPPLVDLLRPLPCSFPQVTKSVSMKFSRRLAPEAWERCIAPKTCVLAAKLPSRCCLPEWRTMMTRSEEHTSELQSRQYLVCRLLLEKKKKK